MVKESLEESDSGNNNQKKQTYIALFSKNMDCITENVFLFCIAAERDSGRCTRGCGGKRTGQGYMNNICEFIVLNIYWSRCIKTVLLCFLNFSFSVYRFFRFFCSEKSQINISISSILEYVYGVFLILFLQTKKKMLKFRKMSILSTK